MGDEQEKEETTTTTQQQTNPIEEHDLDLSLGLRPLKSNDQQIMSNHELKRKAASFSDAQNKGEEDEWFLERRRKVLNIGSGNNAGGFRVYQVQHGENRSSSVSTGSSSGISDSYHSNNSNPGGNSSDTSSASNSSHPRVPSPVSNVPTISPSANQLLSSQENTHLNSSNHNPSSRNVTLTNIIPQPSPKEAKVVIGKPPKPNRQMSQKSVLLPQMPCVSTTGNGPDGKTITGFLYKYSKTEVSIVCVCHGASFSPSGFVEHAGGVHVEHPLKHIRVVPFAPSK